MCRAVNDERVLRYRPLKACKIIVAIAVLHNLCILANVPVYRQNENLANENFNEWAEDRHIDGAEDNQDYGDVLIAGMNVRQLVVDYLEQTRG